MRVLIACEFSGRVRDAFLRRGHDAMSCDILPSDGPHYQGDVLDILDDGWDMMIAHPPCTFLTLSGARWFGDPRYPSRYEDRELAIGFFQKLQAAPIEKIAIENPQPLGYVMERVGRYTQKCQPWWFGEPYTKGLCLWLKNLPPLFATDIVNEREPAVWKMSPGPERQKERSITYRGFAEALAEQYGNEDHAQPDRELFGDPDSLENIGRSVARLY